MDSYKNFLDPCDYPSPCRRCKFRSSLYWLLGVIFCNHSCHTCIDRKKPCDEFVGDYGVQLSLW